MTPLTPEQELELKQECQQIFYDALPARMAFAVEAFGGADLFDLVRGKHSLLSVLYDAPAPADLMRPLIFPLRTYEMIRELRAKEIEDHGGNSSSRDEQEQEAAESAATPRAAS